MGTSLGRLGPVVEIPGYTGSPSSVSSTTLADSPLLPADASAYGGSDTSLSVPESP